jgi:hypothetical protein
MIRIIKSNRLRWGGHAACIEKKRNSHRVSEGNPKEKRTLGRARRRWDDAVVCS